MHSAGQRNHAVGLLIELMGCHRKGILQAMSHQ
jgi:hypothetical protein